MFSKRDCGSLHTNAFLKTMALIAYVILKPITLMIQKALITYILCNIRLLSVHFKPMKPTTTFITYSIKIWWELVKLPGTWQLSPSGWRVPVAFRHLRFKVLSGAAIVMGRRFSHHQEHDFRPVTYKSKSRAQRYAEDGVVSLWFLNRL